MNCGGVLAAGICICTGRNNSTNRKTQVDQLQASQTAGRRSRRVCTRLSCSMAANSQGFSRWRVDSRGAIVARSSKNHTLHVVSWSRSRRGTSSVGCCCAHAGRLWRAEVRWRMAACSRPPSSPRATDASSTARSFLTRSATSFWSLLTNATSSTPTDTNGRGETERQNGSAGQDPQHTDMGKHAVSEETWSRTSQGAPFLCPRSPGRVRRRYPPLSVFRLVLGHFCSFWPESSGIVISVLPYLRGNARWNHRWVSGWPRWAVGRGCSERWAGGATVAVVTADSSKEQCKQSG